MSYDQRLAEVELKLRRVLRAIDEGLTEADVELAIKTVEQEREAAQQEREAASILRREKAAVTAKLFDWQRYVNEIIVMLGGGAPLVVLVKRLQDQIVEARASRDRAIAVSNVDLDKRREVEAEMALAKVYCATLDKEHDACRDQRDGAEHKLAEAERIRVAEKQILIDEIAAHAETKATLETVSHNIQWLNEEYVGLEARYRKATGLNAAWNRVVYVLGLGMENYDQPEACRLALIVRRQELESKLEKAERELAEATANSGIIIKAYNERLARMALLEEVVEAARELRGYYHTDGIGYVPIDARKNLIMALSALDRPQQEIAPVPPDTFSIYPTGRAAMDALFEYLVGVNHIHTAKGIVYAGAILNWLSTLDRPTEGDGR